MTTSIQSIAGAGTSGRTPDRAMTYRHWACALTGISLVLPALAVGFDTSFAVNWTLWEFLVLEFRIGSSSASLPFFSAMDLGMNGGIVFSMPILVLLALIGLGVLAQSRGTNPRHRQALDTITIALGFVLSALTALSAVYLGTLPARSAPSALGFWLYLFSVPALICAPLLVLAANLRWARQLSLPTPAMRQSPPKDTIKDTIVMTETNNAPAAQPGLVHGVISCVCAGLGFFIPAIGLVLAIVGLVLGVKAYRAGKQAGYQTGMVLGLIGALVSGISLAVAAFVLLSLVGLVGGIGLMGAMR